ncbi:MAG: Plug domain-containing protein, partial [Pseudomonadota bacterium]
MRNTLSASGFLAMLLGQGGQIAYAQSVSEVADPSPTADVEQQDQPAKATPLEVVTVIGQKIERDLQDTQTSVAVINELDIREQNIINLEDAIQRTANITTLDGANFQIRGVNNRGVAGGGVSPLATVYGDGFALPPSALFGGPTEIWDVAQ